MTASNNELRASREQRFRAVFHATHSDLLKFVVRRVGIDQAEDIVADVFLVAWRRIDGMPTAQEQARPWLFGVARATMLNHHRGSARRDALAVRLSSTWVTNPTVDDVTPRLVDLTAAWRLLTPAEQEAISLTVWEGLTSAQAGQVLGCSAVAYRLRLSRARRSLRRHLDPTAQQSKIRSHTVNTPAEEPRT
ncbi:RNA polymerase sigma factor [Solicola sp. PLA-1-18]|uniref:RNA polymerase sigma factor n=1 Tax=Solicola sp. PLA-1-18 TaxID=3380532 RepID=UPI003B7D1F7E